MHEVQSRVVFSNKKNGSVRQSLRYSSKKSSHEQSRLSQSYQRSKKGQQDNEDLSAVVDLKGQNMRHSMSVRKDGGSDKKKERPRDLKATQLQDGTIKFENGSQESHQPVNARQKVPDLGQYE